MGRITVRVEDWLKRELQAEARERGVKSSDVVREAIEAHLRARPSRESGLDMARRIGLIGCARDLPPDLSTNRDHFEGFGRA
jgi:metal-responsive CopG/Arc/MetJ family transcriptional regulator